MGYLFKDNGEDNGQARHQRIEEYDTISCKHCQGVIKIILRGCTKAAATKYRCSRCNGPICKYCAETLKGECSPVALKIAHAVKSGKWDPKVLYTPRYIPT